jgi:Glycosyl hydrolases family 18
MLNKFGLVGILGIAGLSIFLSITAGNSSGAVMTPISIYGSWHCGNDFCTWTSVRDMTEFDNKNHWLIDRGNGVPSVNLVVLSFVHPMRLLNKTTDSQTLLGVPRGMTQEIVNYFKSRNIRVMLSIGGITYVDPWNQALATNATQLGLNAAEVAQRLGVGIEIDYEENNNPDLTGLQAFIDAYRSVLPYDHTGNNHAARLTIDLAAGDRWLIDLTQKATADWLNTANPVLDYANAMVPARQPSSSSAITNWKEHVDGKPQYDPPIPPLAPAKFTGSLFISIGRKRLPECVNFAGSVTNTTGNFVRTVAPNGAGTTSGMLGYMFWAAECEGTRSLCTTPPNSCEGGVGVGASTYNISIPMPPLRQQ